MPVRALATTSSEASSVNSREPAQRVPSRCGCCMRGRGLRHARRRREAFGFRRDIVIGSGSSRYRAEQDTLEGLTAKLNDRASPGTGCLLTNA